MPKIYVEVNCVCEVCGEKFTYMVRKCRTPRRTCNNSCQLELIWAENKNNMINGIRKGVKTRECGEWRKNVAKSNKKMVKTAKWKKNFKNGMKERSKTNWFIKGTKKRSEAVVKRLLDKNDMFGKTVRERYKGIYMRSLWEVQFAKSLDILGVDWLYESIVVEFNDGRKKIIDFFIPELNMVVEVKPHKFKNQHSKALQKLRMNKVSALFCTEKTFHRVVDKIACLYYC